METNYEAIILAGGEAWRLKPDIWTSKPMLKIGNWTLLEYQIRWLMKSGIKHIIVASDQEYKIRHSFEEFVTWSVEPYQKGTGGAVMIAIDHLKDKKQPFYLMNVDDIVLGHSPSMLLFPETEARILVAKPRLGFGMVRLRQELVLGFKEKPYADFYVSCGHYAFKKHMVDTYFPDNGNLEDKVLPNLAKRRKLESQRTSQWYTINTSKDYQIIKTLLEQGNTL